MLDWPEKPELGLNCKMLGIFCSQKPASPSVSGTLLWQAHALLFKKSEIWVLDEWTFICSNSHLSWTFLVSLYPQAPKLFYLLKRMTISYSQLVTMFFSIYSFLPLCICESQRSNGIYFKFKIIANPKKKKKPSSDELRLAMSSNYWGWLGRGPWKFRILFSVLSCVFEIFHMNTEKLFDEHLVTQININPYICSQ